METRGRLYPHDCGDQLILAPPPLYSRVVNTATERASADYIRWFNSLVAYLKLTSYVPGTASLTAQSDSVAATAIQAGVLEPGLYRVSYYLRVTRAATSSSSIALTIRWTDGAIACNYVSGATTGNTTATVLQGSVLVSVDKGSSITYETTYASVGATTMQYALSVRVEALP